MHSVYVGYDAREAEAFAVCRHSLRAHLPGVPVHALHLDTLRAAGLYTRPTSNRPHQGNAVNLWDDISEAPMSTEFANSRWLVPLIARPGGLALFMDCDFLALSDIAPIFDLMRPEYAVMCVKHHYAPVEKVKMDGQAQTLYARKNWSSCVLWNLAHPSSKKLTLQMVNGLPGRDLHRFCWLEDHEIGELPPEWNYLVGHTALPDGVRPKLVHFTAGGPWFERFKDVEFAAEWNSAHREWMGALCR